MNANEKIWNIIFMHAKHYARVYKIETIEELIASLDEAGKRFFDQAVSENLADRWPEGFLRRENVGGPGAMCQGPFCSYREVRPDGEFFLACLGAFGADDAEKAWSEHKEVLVNPPKVYEEQIVADASFEDLDFSDCDEQYLEKNKAWARGFIERLAEGRLAEVHYFREDSDWYSLIGYQAEDGHWSIIPTPVFWSLWPKTVVPVDKMDYDAEPHILSAFPQITRSERWVYERAQNDYVSQQETYAPVEDVRGFVRMETARDGLGCTVIVPHDELERIVALPWEEQVTAYMAALDLAHQEHVKDDATYPNLPTVEEGKVVYRTGTGNTLLTVKDGVFYAERLGDGVLSRSHPEIYELAGGQPYPGYTPLSERKNSRPSSVGGRYVRLV